MKTYQEEIAALKSEIAELHELLNKDAGIPVPEQPVPAQSDKEILERLKALEKRVENSENFFGETEAGGNESIGKKRMTFTLTAIFGSIIATCIMYKWFLPLFSIAYGFMIVSLLLGFLLIFDRYFLPGDTIGRVSKNAVSVGIAWFAIVLLLVGGLSLGHQLISRPFDSAEGGTTISAGVEAGQPAGQQAASAGKNNQSPAPQAPDAAAKVSRGDGDSER